MKKTTTKIETNKQKQVQKLQNVINVFLDDKKKKAKAKKKRRKKKMASIVKPDMRYTLPTINFLLNPPPPNPPQPFVPFPPRQPFRGDIRSPQMGLDTSIPARIGSEPVPVPVPVLPEPERITPEPEPEPALTPIYSPDVRSLMTLTDYDDETKNEVEPEPFVLQPILSSRKTQTEPLERMSFETQTETAPVMVVGESQTETAPVMVVGESQTEQPLMRFDQPQTEQITIRVPPKPKAVAKQRVISGEESKTEPEEVLIQTPSPQQRSLEDILQSRVFAEETKEQQEEESMPLREDLRLGRITSNRSVISTPEKRVKPMTSMQQKIYKKKFEKLDSDGLVEAIKQLEEGEVVKTDQMGARAWVINPFTKRQIEKGTDYYNTILSELNSRLSPR